MLGVIVTTLDKTFQVTEVAPGPTKETVGWFGFCQRFDTEESREKFIDYLQTQGYTQET